ncbi:hypothetical protein K9L67_04025 [Candidatus Woesearchaeota archaeon]|nr:hypothetical protein [Candidatus Woesearchaeota archaeon]MCF7901369.1 hypothetical protein [Candidatus Woesearchaeota archaeon]MCF8013369.1 hypothetical protein [Candidatus Woesearchaeota archaeon]
MIIKLLGLLDLLTGLFILLYNFELLGIKLFISAILYLLIKGLAFRGDTASFTDLGIAIFMILMIFSPHTSLLTVLSLITTVWMFQKGAISLL